MADFEFYALSYRGLLISDEDVFSSLAVRAKRYVDSCIGDRTNLKYSQIVDRYNYCICEVAEILYKAEENEKQTVTSESVGNHSKTFAKISRTDKETDSAKSKAVHTWLGDTGLLYRGGILV